MQTVRTVRFVTFCALHSRLTILVFFWFRTSKQTHFKELFQSRVRAEDQAASMRIPRNHLLVSSLVALLEERQNLMGSSGAAAQLAEKYTMDVGRLESLAHSVNVPRVREGSVRYIRDAQSGEETVISEVGFAVLVAAAIRWSILNT